ncbi:MAG: hypothetical protein SFT92_01270 [Rickettsiales bacterium]|nr:hypothetical protein [Rickettsiales bacterium]
MSGLSASLSNGWRQQVWFGLLVVASVAFSLIMACATPFAAFAILAAMSMNATQGRLVIVVIWAVNQLVGYLLLHYPQTADSFIWGGVMLVAALVTHEVVRRLLDRNLPLNKAAYFSAAFLVAFTVNQTLLLLAALTPLSGLSDFTLAIVGEMLLINLFAVVSLFAINRLLAVSSPAAVSKAS